MLDVDWLRRRFQYNKSSGPCFSVCLLLLLTGYKKENIIVTNYCELPCSSHRHIGRYLVFLVCRFIRFMNLLCNAYGNFSMHIPVQQWPSRWFTQGLRQHPNGKLPQQQGVKAASWLAGDWRCVKELPAATTRFLFSASNWLVTMVLLLL